MDTVANAAALMLSLYNAGWYSYGTTPPQWVIAFAAWLYPNKGN